ncbi:MULTISPECIES: nitroreductase family protein [unclassified Bradyrhizobium]|uniref:nitroreductase family protein n=1 Tax=unclassified Bradyrhizobium TaxID=2631580 RepID=UPI0020B2FDCE|nr:MULTISPECIES: nitroreductase family protein [unclassified Bradyrhizobium]MCP3379957.1 nitroreductase family protein [Bradyrhizobium sp. CCGUVB4N]MCP3440796.1 nitroreductase family protein [Bradyrhizobium sp. CCGUVB14]
MDEFHLLSNRFGPEAADLELEDGAPAVHKQLVKRGSVRKFRPEQIPDHVLRRLCALALCAPTKSDLQQRDIIIIDSPALRSEICVLLASGRLGQNWLEEVPNLLIFCGNNRRQRRLHALRARPFVNDHLDAFFNATVDAAIALSSFVVAAEAEGLGVCPISAVRNHPDRLAELLNLPEHVFPVAGLAVGYPDDQPPRSLRLPLPVTIHHNTYTDDTLDAAIEEYDRRRSADQPYVTQRYVNELGRSESYGWSEDKARQYAFPERQDFGAYVKRIGFKLD